MFIEDKKILDGTFRDGGYYTNWIFNEDVIDNYLKLSGTGIFDTAKITYSSINKLFF